MTLKEEAKLREQKMVEEIQERVKAILIEKGITRTELSRRMGKNIAFVSYLLRKGRKGSITLRTITAMEIALGEQLFETAVGRAKKFPPFDFTTAA